MINFFKNKKPVVLNLYTHRSEVYNYASPDKTKKFIPEWFKKIAPSKKNSTGFGNTTLKQCSGFLDYFNNGFILPLWSDLSITVGTKEDPSWEYQYSDRKSNIEIHDSRQWGNCKELEDYNHFKLDNPWIATCDEEVKFLWTPSNFLFTETDIQIPSGVIEFKHQAGLNIQFYLKRGPTPKTILLKHGTPLVHLSPLTERSFEIRTHLVSLEEYSRIAGKAASITFSQKYRAITKIMNKKKCPYQHELSKK